MGSGRAGLQCSGVSVEELVPLSLFLAYHPLRPPAGLAKGFDALFLHQTVDHVRIMLCCGAALATLREELRDAELVTLAPGASYAQETSLARPCA